MQLAETIFREPTFRNRINVLNPVLEVMTGLDLLQPKKFNTQERNRWHITSRLWEMFGPILCCIYPSLMERRAGELVRWDMGGRNTACSNDVWKLFQQLVVLKAQGRSSVQRRNSHSSPIPPLYQMHNSPKPQAPWLQAKSYRSPVPHTGQSEAFITSTVNKK